MQFLRATALRRSALAFLLVASALLVKSVIPAGYMVAEGTKVLTVQVCSAATGHAVAPMKIEVPVKEGGGKDAGLEAKQDCAFGTLSMAALGGVDPALLLAAIAFILALGSAPVGSVPQRQPLRLRPPLRGPPLPA